METIKHIESETRMVYEEYTNGLYSFDALDKKNKERWVNIVANANSTDVATLARELWSESNPLWYISNDYIIFEKWKKVAQKLLDMRSE